MAKKWAAFPYTDKAHVYDSAGLKKNWARLHRGDCEPMPKEPGVLEAWRHFHAGAFGDAVEAGRRAGGAGINAAIKAQMIYANYLEKSDKTKLALLEEAAGWADARRSEAAKNANAHYYYAYALGRYSQGISIAKALAHNAMLVAAYWPSYDRVRNADREKPPVPDAGRAAYQVMTLFGPYLAQQARAHLDRLAASYL